MSKKSAPFDQTVKEKAIYSIKWTGFVSVFNGLAQLLQFLVLSHYVSPEEWGMYTIIYLIIVLSYYFIDAGISNSLFAKKDIHPDQLSTLYWVNILSGLLITALVFGVSPAIADFYREPKLDELVKITSGLFLVIPIGMQYRYLFQKHFDFRTIGIIESIGTIVNLVVSIALAVKGQGALSLIAGAYGKHAIESGCYLLFGLKLHKPSFVFRLSEVSFFLRFGLFQMSEKIIDYIGNQLDLILVGKLISTEQLGYYSFAKNIVSRPLQLINPVITKVTTPLFAQFQDDTEYLKQLFLKTISRLANVNFPIYWVLILTASDVVSLFFGDKWLPAVPALQALCCFAMIASLGNPMGSLLIAKSKADWGLYMNTSLLLATGVLVVIGVNGGIEGVAISMILLQLLAIYPIIRYIVSQLLPIQANEYWQAVAKPFYIASASAILPFIYRHFFDFGYLSNLCFIIAFYGITFAMLIAFCSKEVISDLKKFL